MPVNVALYSGVDDLQVVVDTSLGSYAMWDGLVDYINIYISTNYKYNIVERVYNSTYSFEKIFQLIPGG